MKLWDTGWQRVKWYGVGVAEFAERRLSERNTEILGDSAATLRSVHDAAAYRSTACLHRYTLWTQATITHGLCLRVTRDDYRHNVPSSLYHRRRRHYSIISVITPIITTLTILQQQQQLSY